MRFYAESKSHLVSGQNFEIRWNIVYPSNIITKWRPNHLKAQLSSKKQKKSYRFHQLPYFSLRKLSTKFGETSFQLFKSDRSTIICVHAFEHFFQANDFFFRKIFSNNL